MRRRDNVKEEGGVLQLTGIPIEFPMLDLSGHLYRGQYGNGTTAVFAGPEGRIGKLSVNLVEHAEDLGPDEFFVKLYGEGDYVNGPCWLTGLFEQVGDVFTTETSRPGCFYRRWRLK